VAWADSGHAYDNGAASSVSLAVATILEVHEGSANSPSRVGLRAGQIQADGGVVWNAAGSQYTAGGAERPSGCH
jgi:hypothetical protein